MIGLGTRGSPFYLAVNTEASWRPFFGHFGWLKVLNKVTIQPQEEPIGTRQQGEPGSWGKSNDTWTKLWWHNWCIRGGGGEFCIAKLTSLQCTRTIYWMIIYQFNSRAIQLRPSVLLYFSFLLMALLLPIVDKKESESCTWTIKDMVGGLEQA